MPRAIPKRPNRRPTAEGALASADGYPRIRVYRQKGPGYWACIYFDGGGIEAVQSPQIYGFPTKEEARAEALRRCADNSPDQRQSPPVSP